MAYNPYALTRVARPTPTAPAGGKYALTRQAPLTANAQEAEQQNLNGLKTGRFADVESAQVATQRANAMRTSQGLQAARGTIARSGDVSPEAALRAQDQALAQASAQNLNADNAVNQMRRTYRNDALNRADTIEDRAYGQASNERSYQTDADRYADDQKWKGYDADVNEENRLFGENFQLGQADRSQANTDRDFGEGTRRFDLTREDQKGSQAEDTRRFDLTYGANRADTAWNQNNTVSQQADNRSRFDLTRGDANSQFDKTFGASREDAADNRNRFDLTRGDANTQFDKTFTASREDAADNRDRFDLTRADSNTQFGMNYAANREDAATAKDQFGQTLDQRKTEFGVTSSQQQQQIENQAAQAAAQMGFNYASLSQEDQHYLKDLVQRQSEFVTTSDQNQQQINNQVSQFGVTSGQNQQQIDNQVNQFGKTFDYQAGRDATADARYDQTYADNREDVTYDRDNASRLEGKTDALAAINAIQDPKARQAAYNTYMQGGDVSQFITGTLYDSTGGLNKDYASASPGQQAYQARIEELKALNPKIISESGLDNETDAEYEKRIGALAQKQASAEYETSVGPVQDAALQRSVTTKLSSGAPLTPEEQAYGVKAGLVNTFTAKSLPKNTAANALKGQQVNVDGQVYTVVGGSNYITETSVYGIDKHSDYTILDQGGKRIYVLSDGTITNDEPQDKESSRGSLF